MIYPEDIQLFSIHEFSRACGVSRASLLRMEECGFLTPYRIDPETGYRYYDAHNAAEVGQFQLLQTLGLSRREITDYYYEKYSNLDFLKQQRIKLNRMQRVLEELELRSDPSCQFSFSFLELPDITCYCDTEKFTSLEDSETFFYKTHMESIGAGFQMDGMEPLFGLSDNEFHMSDNFSAISSKTTACIPIVAPDHQDPHVITFKATHAFSCLAKGDYSIIPELCVRFWKEIDQRNLNPAGRARFIGLVSPYSGKHIQQDKYCYRLLVPISPDQSKQ